MSTPSASVVGSVDEIGEGPLRTLVEQGTGGTLFHRYEWLKAVEEGMAWTPRHLVVSADGNPVGLLPTFRRGVSLPHGLAERVADAASIEGLVPPPPGYGGPVVAGEESAVVEALLDGVADLADATTLFHRVQHYDGGAVRYSRALQARGYEPRVDRCTFLIDLDRDWPSIREGMDASRRKAVRRGVEQDHEVRMTGLDEGLEETHEMYVGNMERVGGEVLPVSFFEGLADRLPNRVRVASAAVDGREVGRYVYLLDESGSVLHHWLSAIPDSDDFDDYPSELLHRRAIRWGIEADFDRYSFGPTAPHFADSVFRFKERYGGRPVPLLCWEKGALPVAWRAYKAGRSWYQRSQVEV